MSEVPCAFCEQPDPTGLGVCTGCAGPARVLIFLQPLRAARHRWTAAEALTRWLNVPPALRSFDEVLNGHKPLVAIAHTHSEAALRALGQLDLLARALPIQQRWRHLPMAYLLILSAVLPGRASRCPPDSPA